MRTSKTPSEISSPLFMLPMPPKHTPLISAKMWSRETPNASPCLAPPGGGATLQEGGAISGQGGGFVSRVACRTMPRRPSPYASRPSLPLPLSLFLSLPFSPSLSLPLFLSPNLSLSLSSSFSLSLPPSIPPSLPPFLVMHTSISFHRNFHLGLHPHTSSRISTLCVQVLTLASFSGRSGQVVGRFGGVKARLPQAVNVDSTHDDLDAMLSLNSAPSRPAPAPPPTPPHTHT